MTSKGGNGVVLGVSGVAKEDIQAYISNYGAHRPGITTEECVRYYNKIADTYEEVNTLRVHDVNEK